MLSHVAAIELTGQIGPGTIVTALASIVAAWVGNENRKKIKEVKETTHKINKAVNDVPDNEQSIGDNVKEVLDRANDINDAVNKSAPGEQSISQNVREIRDRDGS
jgi:methyl-accepting chemotaxis protein